MSVVGPIAAKKLQGRECSEVFSLQQTASSFDQVAHTDGHQPFAERDVMECRCPSDHSGLTLADSTTLPHFSVSSAITFPKSAGVPGNGVPPRSARRAFKRVP